MKLAVSDQLVESVPSELAASFVLSPARPCSGLQQAELGRLQASVSLSASSGPGETVPLSPTMKATSNQS